MITSQSGAISLLTFESSSISWWISNDKVVRGQLNTGSLRTLEVVLVNWKKIYRLNFFNGVSIVHPAMGRLMQLAPVGREHGVSWGNWAILPVGRGKSYHLGKFAAGRWQV